MHPLQVVAEPTRREILRLIWDRERSAGEIAGHFDLTFGAVSHHLGVLREAGYVQVRKEGTQRIYRAATDRLGPLRSVLETMWASTLERLAESLDDSQR